jgi:hypothetical protein
MPVEYHRDAVFVCGDDRFIVFDKIRRDWRLVSGLRFAILLDASELNQWINGSMDQSE